MRCNSCYTFAANALIEAWTRRETGIVISLSEQEILDCDTVDQDCKGGLPSNAIDYIIKNKIAFSKDYPYEGKKETNARFLPLSAVESFQLGFSIDKYNFNGSGRSEWKSPSPSKRYSSQEYSYTVPSSFTSPRKYKHNYSAPLLFTTAGHLQKIRIPGPTLPLLVLFLRLKLNLNLFQ